MAGFKKSIVKQLLKKHKFSKKQAYKCESFKNIECRDEQFKNIANALINSGIL